MSRYDAIILGSGQAGTPLAKRLAQHGWSVALIEQTAVGGTCINTGCTPTKTMIASAQIAHYARHAADWGVSTGPVQVDLPQVVARENRVVGQMRSHQEHAIGELTNLRLLRGHGRFVAPHTVQVGDEQLESDRIFINTGAQPELPHLEGLDQVPYLTNATMIQLTKLPEHLLVLGGGYIGAEFGQMFRRFGSRVSIIHRGQHLLSREDDDIATELQNVLVAEGIEFHFNTRPTRVQQQSGQILLSVEGPQGPITLRGSHLLVATGRRPNTDDLGLAAAGVQTDPRGSIRVNARLETSVPGIWALGDVKGGPAFTHISFNDYQIVYGNLIEGKTLSTDGRLVPYAVFTDPELGRVGMTEQEAKATGRRLKVGKVPMSQVSRAIERGETAGLMKLVVDAATDKILGAAILGADGGETVQLLGAVMLAGAPYTLLKGAVYIHPTMAEGFWTLMEEVKAL